MRAAGLPRPVSRGRTQAGRQHVPGGPRGRRSRSAFPRSGVGPEEDPAADDVRTTKEREADRPPAPEVTLRLRRDRRPDVFAANSSDLGGRHPEMLAARENAGSPLEATPPGQQDQPPSIAKTENDHRPETGGERSLNWKGDGPSKSNPNENRRQVEAEGRFHTKGRLDPGGPCGCKEETGCDGGKRRSNPRNHSESGPAGGLACV